MNRMKKRTFTLLVLSVLLSGMFSTMKAQTMLDSVRFEIDTVYPVGIYETLPPSTSIKIFFSGPATNDPDTFILSSKGAAEYLGFPGSFILPKKKDANPDSITITASEAWKMPHAENKTSGYIRVNKYNAAAQDTITGGVSTKSFIFYNQPEFDVKFSMKTVQYPGALELIVLGGNQNLMTRGIADEISAYARDTAISIPFSQAEIGNLKYGDTIYVKYLGITYSIIIPGISEEPGPGGFNRPITIPNISDATTNYGPGVHQTPSGEDFIFIITPSGNNRNLNPVVKTGRDNDTEGGVKYEQLADGSWKITIVRVQSSINLSIDFSVNNESIDNNKVWANGSQLYITSSTSGKASIYNAAGALVKTITFAAGETTSTNLPTGFYVATVNGESYKISVK